MDGLYKDITLEQCLSVLNVCENKFFSDKAKEKNIQNSNDDVVAGLMFPVNDILLNLFGKDNRYLKCSIDLEQSTPSLAVELEGKKGEIRDIIISVLSSKTYEDVSTTKGKQRLKNEIKDKINAILNDGFIKNIYFTDFVIS